MKTSILFIASALLSLFSARAQVITTYAGTHAVAGFDGDGGNALGAKFYEPYCVAADRKGNVYIADLGNSCIRKINSAQVITTFAGIGGARSSSGDGGPATLATIDAPTHVAVDKWGNVYIPDRGSLSIRKVDTLGIITRIAGNGTAGYTGDGGAATAAQISYATAIATDTTGNVYFWDGRIRKVNTAGIISTIAGDGTTGHYAGDGGPAISASIPSVESIAIDYPGNIYISDGVDCRIRKIDTNGIITLFAGSGSLTGFPNGHGGDGGPATIAKLNAPWGLAADAHGNIYICDTWNDAIRIVDTAGVITTVAGVDTVGGYRGDGGPATNALLWFPKSVAVDSSGVFYIVDYNNICIRRVGREELAVTNTSSATTIDVYPNPVFAQGVLQLCLAQPSATYNLRSINGTPIQTGSLVNGRNDIHVESLPSGIYLLEIIDSVGGGTTRKIIKH